MSTPNQDPSRTPEISPTQVKEFVKAIRQHLGPAEPSYLPTEPLKPPSLDELREHFPKLNDDELSRMWDVLCGEDDQDPSAEPEETASPNPAIVELYCGAYFMIGQSPIFLSETSHSDNFYHEIHAMVKSPPVIIDDKFYRQVTKDFRIDLITGAPTYRQTHRIFERATDEMLLPPSAALFWEGDTKGWVDQHIDQFMFNRQRRLDVFDQDKFDEIMPILAQLGPHNRIDA